MFRNGRSIFFHVYLLLFMFVLPLIKLASISEVSCSLFMIHFLSESRALGAFGST